MPTLTLTPNAPQGTVGIAIGDAPRAATNLVANPSFEAADISAWSAYGAGTAIGRSTARASATDAGVASLVITTGTDSLVGASSSVLVTPGKRYGIRLEAFLNNAADIRLRVIYRDAGGAQLTSADYSLPGSPGAAWYTLALDAGVAPANAARVWFYFQRYSAAASGQFIYLDCVTVQELAAGETFTGRYFATTRGGDVSVTRTDTNGTREVRRLAGQAPVNGAMTLTDREASLIGAVSYTVTDAAGQTVTASTSALDTPQRSPRIHQVITPTLVTVPRMLTGYQSTRETATPVHWVEGRSDPVVILRAAKYRAGTLVAYATDYASAAQIDGIARPGWLLMLRQSDHPGMDMYFVTTSSTVEPIELRSGGWVWEVRLEYVEVGYPTAALVTT